jgi:uncharacterized protein YodC (DUF2158 family)
LPKNSEKQFPKGATVKLISGGPIMVVKGFSLDGEIHCQWFSGKKLEQGFFAPETLVLAKNETEERS